MAHLSHAMAEECHQNEFDFGFDFYLTLTFTFDFTFTFICSFFFQIQILNPLFVMAHLGHHRSPKSYCQGVLRLCKNILRYFFKNIQIYSALFSEYHELFRLNFLYQIKQCTTRDLKQDKQDKPFLVIFLVKIYLFGTNGTINKVRKMSYKHVYKSVPRHKSRTPRYNTRLDSCHGSKQFINSRHTTRQVT